MLQKYAAEQNALPSVLGKSSKSGMPVGAAVTNGVIATLIVLIAPLIPSQDVFWSFFALNMITLLMSYILMFPAFLKLRKSDSNTPRPFKVGGGPVKLRIMTYLPMILLIISVIFSIVPLDASSEELGEKTPSADRHGRRHFDRRNHRSARRAKKTLLRKGKKNEKTEF